MRIALLSDTHVHAWSEFSKDDRGVPSRLRHTVDIWAQARKHCVANGIELLVFGGDLFHKRSVLYTQAYNLVVEELAAFARAGIHVLANVGNHDQANREGSVHALQAFASAGLIHVVDHRTGWANVPVNHGSEEATISLFAYTDLTELFMERLERSNVDYAKTCNGPRIGMFHHGFRGAKVGSALEYQVREEIDTSCLSGAFDTIFSGHYHARQVVGEHNHSVMYVGAPMEFVRGDQGSARGLLIYDTTKTGVQRVPLVAPRFVRITDEQLADDDFDVGARVRGNFVDVVFSELPMKWEELVAVLMAAGAEGVHPVPLKRVATAKSSRLDVDASLGERALLEKYLAYRKDDLATLSDADRDALLRCGLDLLAKAQE